MFEEAFQNTTETPSRLRCLRFALFAASLFYSARALAVVRHPYSNFTFDYVKFTASNGEQYAFAFTSVNCIANEATFDGAKNINFAVAVHLFFVRRRLHAGKWHVDRTEVKFERAKTTFSFLSPIKIFIPLLNGDKSQIP